VAPVVSGNILITGNLSLYSTAANLATTGSTLDTKINNLSGYVTGATGIFASIINLASTGSTLDTKINSLSGYINSPTSNIVYTTGNQNISGNKNFLANITISGNLNISGSGLFNSTSVLTQNFYTGNNILKVYQYYNTGTNSLDTVFV
jgi:hypothetical protein